jgi:hypothetical protein
MMLLDSDTLNRMQTNQKNLAENLLKVKLYKQLMQVQETSQLRDELLDGLKLCNQEE